MQPGAYASFTGAYVFQKMLDDSRNALLALPKVLDLLCGIESIGLLDAMLPHCPDLILDPCVVVALVRGRNPPLYSTGLETVAIRAHSRRADKVHNDACSGLPSFFMD
jgi:hypothetical protein